MIFVPVMQKTDTEKNQKNFVPLRWPQEMEIYYLLKCSSFLQSAGCLSEWNDYFQDLVFPRLIFKVCCTIIAIPLLPFHLLSLHF